jgi:hypothetical protein
LAPLVFSWPARQNKNYRRGGAFRAGTKGTAAEKLKEPSFSSVDINAGMIFFYFQKKNKNKPN